MATIEERLEQARQKVSALQALKSKKEAAARAAVSKKQRAADTRTKVLLGAYLQEAMERDPALKERVMAGLDKFLTRPTDRSIFSLE